MLTFHLQKGSRPPPQLALPQSFNQAVHDEMLRPLKLLTDTASQWSLPAVDTIDGNALDPAERCSVPRANTNRCGITLNASPQIT